MGFDCGFIQEKKWFRYRAAAVIIEENCILFAENEIENYYYSVGGGVHIGEKAEEAVVREVYEETGIYYEVDRLIFIHENFFKGDGGLKGLDCHEIAFYFLMKPIGKQEINRDSYTLNGAKEHMIWIPIQELHKHKLFPTFLKNKINNFSNGIEHIITSE